MAVMRGVNRVPKDGEFFAYAVEDSLQTLNQYMGRIKEYALAAIGDPYVLDAARKITMGCRPYDRPCETNRAFKFVKDRFRYVPAPAKYGVEVLQTARKMLADIENLGQASGECEEMAVLLAAILGNLNHEVAFRYGGDSTASGEPNFKHIWVADRLPEVQPSNGGWVDLDASGYLRPGQHFEFEVYGWDFLAS